MSDAALQEFRDRVEAFLVEKGIKPSPFGWKACRDRSFVADLRAGKREFRPSTLKKVETFMAEYPPSEDNVSASGDPSDGQEKSARAAGAPQKEQAA